MDGILHKKFAVEFEIPTANHNAVQRYLEDNVGPRNYYLHSQVGGKNWALKRSPRGTSVVCVADPELATFITLKFL